MSAHVGRTLGEWFDEYIYIYLGNRTTILKWSKTAFKLEVAVSQESGRLLFSI